MHFNTSQNQINKNLNINQILEIKANNKEPKFFDYNNSDDKKSMQSGDERVSQTQELTVIQKSLLPPRPSCLGCRTYFIQHQKLQLEDIFVEFKNYNQIPLKEPKHQFIILKTITAFLNTKGGSIYLGVEDGKCEVIGNVVSTPKQNEFKNFISEILLEIYPQVDRKNVKTFFIPILKRNGIFTGRYITKILVSQGKIDTFYSFAQKIKLVCQKANEGEEFEERIGYIRLGPGGLQKVEGQKLYDEIYKKAKDPNEQFFVHQGCHPDPMPVISQIKILAFRIPKQKQCQISNLIVKTIHDVGKTDYSQHFDQNLNMMIIQFQSSVITEAMRDKVELLQKRVINQLDRIKYQGIQNHMFIFGPVETKDVMIKERKQKKINQRNEQKRIRDQMNEDKKDKERQKQEEKVMKYFGEEQSKNQGQTKYIKKGDSFYFVITHLNINMVEEFMQFLRTIIPKKFKLDFHINSIGIKINQEEDLYKIEEKIKKMRRQLSVYGHNNLIKFGKSNGHIQILNYIQKDKEKLKQSVYKLLTKYEKKISFKPLPNNQTTTYLDIEVDQRTSPQVLDVLLAAKDLRRFKDKDIKMKFMLQCQ